MANVTIDGLPAAPQANDTDLLEVSQNLASRKITRAQLLAGAALSGHTHAVATTGANGFLSSADKAKLDGIAAGATVNATNAELRDRSTHTGAQGIGTITGLQTALDGKAATSHPHTASQISDFSEAVDDEVASLLVAGSNIVVTYNDAGNTLTIALASSPNVSGSLSDSKGNVRDLPVTNRTAAYTAALSDTGGIIRISAGGVTIPSGVFSPNHAFSILNNSASNQTITQGSGVTLRLAGTTTTGNRTLAPYGLCTVTCVAANEFVISGAGLS